MNEALPNKANEANTPNEANEVNTPNEANAPTQATSATDAPPPGKPSGLRNPKAAVRGVGSAALVCETLTLLLAIQPMRVLGVHLTGAAIGSIVALAVICVLLCGVLRFNWAWYAGFAVQAALMTCGFFHPSLAVLGVLFALVWGYVFSVRRSVLGKQA
jgi:hypothetical protein